MTVIVLLFVLIFLVLNQKKRSLHQDNSTAIAHIYKVDPGIRGGVVLMYSFNVNGVKHFGKTIRFVSYNYADMFAGKYFALAYCNSNPDNNEILVFSEDYYDFGLNFPDSLGWVERLKE